MPKLATYIIPDPSTRFYQIGSAVLGYDVFAVRDMSCPDELLSFGSELRTWVGPAHQYGFHATIGDALEYPEEQVDEIETRLAWISGRIRPFALTNGRIHTPFRAFPRVLVATFDCPDGELQRLEELVVTTVNPLHTASPVFGPRLDTFNELQRTQFIRFGSPDVRSLFDLHFSLATNIPDEETWHRLSQALVEDAGLFATPDQRTTLVDRIHLLEQRSDGRFGIRRTFTLTGTATPNQPGSRLPRQR